MVMRRVSSPRRLTSALIKLRVSSMPSRPHTTRSVPILRSKPSTIGNASTLAAATLTLMKNRATEPSYKSVSASLFTEIDVLKELLC